MKIHIGKIIKAELAQQNISVTEFAKKMNTSRSAVYGLFEQESICCDLLTKIGKILKCNFFSLYSAQKLPLPGPQSTPCTLIEQKANYTPDEVAAIIKQKEALEREIIYLKKIISLMEQ